MARSRVSASQLEDAVIEAVRAAGGSITHNDLVAQLEAAGTASAVNLILPLGQSGRLVPNLKVQPDGGKPVLRYSLPNESEG